MKIEMIDIKKIAPSPFGSRGFDSESLELAEDIFRHGLMQPVAVTPSRENPEEYVCVFGHRRIDAVRILFERGDWNSNGEIPAIVAPRMSDGKLGAMGYSENAARDNPAPTAVAEGIARGMRRSRDAGLNQDSMAEWMGVAPSKFKSDLRAIKLPPKARELLESARMSAHTSWEFLYLSGRRHSHDDIMEEVVDALLSTRIPSDFSAFRTSEARRAIAEVMSSKLEEDWRVLPSEVAGPSDESFRAANAEYIHRLPDVEDSSKSVYYTCAGAGSPYKSPLSPGAKVRQEAWLERVRQDPLTKSLGLERTHPISQSSESLSFLGTRGEFVESPQTLQFVQSIEKGERGPPAYFDLNGCVSMCKTGAFYNALKDGTVEFSCRNRYCFQKKMRAGRREFAKETEEDRERREKRVTVRAEELRTAFADSPEVAVSAAVAALAGDALLFGKGNPVKPCAGEFDVSEFDLDARKLSEAAELLGVSAEDGEVFGATEALANGLERLSPREALTPASILLAVAVERREDEKAAQAL